jgi:hypothetical protein
MDENEIRELLALGITEDQAFDSDIGGDSEADDDIPTRSASSSCSPGAATASTSRTRSTKRRCIQTEFEGEYDSDDSLAVLANESSSSDDDVPLSRIVIPESDSDAESVNDEAVNEDEDDRDDGIPHWGKIFLDPVNFTSATFREARLIRVASRVVILQRKLKRLLKRICLYSM